MAIRAQFNQNVSSSVVEEMRAYARDVDVAIGDLTDLFLRFALSKMPREQVRQWAATRALAPAGALTKRERAVVKGLEALRASDKEGAWRFRTDDIGNAAGMRFAEAYWALQALRQRELVGFMDLAPGEVDRWERPTRAVWWLSAHEPGAKRPNSE